MTYRGPQKKRASICSPFIACPTWLVLCSAPPPALEAKAAGENRSEQPQCARNWRRGSDLIGWCKLPVENNIFDRITRQVDVPKNMSIGVKRSVAAGYAGEAKHE